MTEYAPDPNFKHPVCRGSWALGNNCKVCERCIATHPGSKETLYYEMPGGIRLPVGVAVHQPYDTNHANEVFRDTERKLRQRIAELEARVAYLDGGARVGRFRICLPYSSDPDKIAIYDGPEGGDFNAEELEELIARFYEERF